jgi:hypothetical protein
MKTIAGWALCALFTGSALADVRVLDIDRVGPEVLTAIKAAPAVQAWAELGDSLVIETGRGYAKRGDLRRREIALLPVERLAQLVSRPLVHCNGEEVGHDKHASPVDAVLFERGHWQLLAATAKVAGDEALAPGRVVAYQQANRPPKQLRNDAAIDAVVAAIDIAHWRSQVNTLATHHRQTAVGFEAAARHVEQQFGALGLAVSRQLFTPPSTVAVDGRNFNVLGLQAGGGQGLLIVGAHLDARNRTWDEALPSPGAEDNGSGCAGVIETARVLRGRRLAADVLYVCYGLEERGLYGGSAHAAAQTPSQVLGVINMDMIAYEGDGLLDVSLQATAPGFGLQQRLADNAARYTPLLVEIAQQTCCSDHQPYLDRGMPAVLLIENDYRIYPQYHTVDDTADRLSDAMALEVLKMAVATAAEVARLQSGQQNSGYWYDPGQSGHGFQIEVQDSGLVFLTWYTFDASGNRLWVIATGPLAGNRATLAAHVASGGRFPPEFRREDVSVTPWGSIEVEFVDCGHTTIRWTPLASTGLAAGSMTAVRSSEPLGAGCSD